MLSSRKIIAIVLLGLSLSGLAYGAGEDPKLTLPTVQLPEAGTLQGSAAKFGVEASSMSQGSISLPLPIEVDQRKGPLLFNPFPSYSPHNGISAWGMGWEAKLSIMRYREIGDVNFQNDLLTSPWGILEKGSDGFWYPRGLRSPVKVSFGVTGAEATLADGTQLSFQKIIPTSASSQDFGFVLTKAQDLKGHISLYRWQDDKQRLILDEVRYGGYEENSLAYSVRLLYSTLETKGFHFSFRSRKAIPVDRMITGVQFFDIGTGLLKARWSYELGYSSSKYSPAFHLKTVKRSFASGSAEPAVSFGYEIFDDWILRREYETLGGMEPVIKAVGNRYIRPDTLSIYDYNLDGLMDVETASDHQLYIQTQNGFVASQKFTAAVPNLCLPSDRETNRSRTVTRMTGYRGDLKVLVRQSKNQGAKTELIICSLEGVVEKQLLIDANYNLDPRTAFGDVNQDGKPDFVRLLADSYTVLLNTSVGNNYQFEVKGPFPIKNANNILQLDIADVNGDGLADLVARDQDQLRVFAGMGDLAFIPTAIPFPFLDDKGSRQTLNGTANNQYIDANADGLLDLSFTEGSRFFLLMNRGTDFVRVRLPEVEGTLNEGEALTLNVAGSGEPMIVRTSNVGIRALRLSHAGMSLLKSWDDGRGSSVIFEYSYGKAVDGQYKLPKIISSVRKSVTGKGSIVSKLDYERPTLDPILPSYRGFEEVRVDDPGLTTTVSFQNPKEAPGLPRLVSSKDLRGQGFSKVSETEYATRAFRGLQIYARKSMKSFSSDGPKIAGLVETSYEFKDESLCEFESLTKLGSDLLKVTREFESVTRFDQAMSCLPTFLNEQGTHARREFDFVHRYKINRNDAGDPLEIVMINGSQQRMLQKLEYDESFRLSRAVELSGVSHTFAYRTGTDLLESHSTSVGVVSRIESREPNGLVKELLVNKGGLDSYSKTFAYDGFERLQSVADNAGSSGPLDVYGYEFPSASIPGRIRKETHPADNIEMRRDQYVTADGDALGTMEYLLEGQVLAGLKSYNVGSGQEAAFARSQFSGDFLSEWSSLQARGAKKSESISDGFGKAFAATLIHQQDVKESLKYPSVLEGIEFLRKQVSNETYETWSRLDGLGRETAKRDEAGHWTTIAYDMIGRPREVKLADNQTQAAYYDNWGQMVEMRRSSLGSIQYRYNQKGLLEDKDFMLLNGTVYRSQHFEYDIHGRIAKRTSTADQISHAISFYYDGYTPTPEFYPDQKGHLTAIKGEHFQTRFLYDQKGRLISEVKSIDKGGVRKTTVNTWYDDDRLKTSDVTVDVSGTQTRRTNWEYVLRSDGRLSEIKLNSRTLADLKYNDLGLLESADLDSGKLVVAFSYDPVTSFIKGYVAAGSAHEASYELDKDNRGNIRHEYYNGKKKTYSYDERSFLKSVDGAEGIESFAYNKVGLMDVDPILAKGLVYDETGRLRQKGEMFLSYDGQGQIESVRMGDDSFISYGYDENDLRNLKTRNGEFHTARFGDQVITRERILEPLKVGGIVVGLIENGVFRPLLGDPRGTVIDDGSRRSQASAYGQRPWQEAWQSAIDYAGHSRDEDTGLIRMGMRDYDPAEGKFIEPDQVFLESLDRCLESTVECNLFGYVNNNPLIYIDPFGTTKNPTATISEKTGVSKLSGEGTNSEASSRLGMRIHPLSGTSKMHWGSDFSNPNNGAVMAVESGTVIVVRNNASTSGNYIVVESENGDRFKYFHTYSSLAEGTKVEEGKNIGRTDLSGGTTGPHLHLQITTPENKVIESSDYLKARLSSDVFDSVMSVTRETFQRAFGTECKDRCNSK